MRIIGIDPGTATTGFGILDSNDGKFELLDFGCICTDKGLSRSERLNQISKDITTLVNKWEPEIASVEKLFFKKNVKTAIAVAEARGVILQKLSEKCLNLEEYSPLEIKSTVCGYGKADKKAVQQMVKIILNLNQAPKSDDAADAIAAALCCALSNPLKQMVSKN